MYMFYVLTFEEFYNKITHNINESRGGMNSGNIKKRDDAQERFIELAKELHGDVYDYSKVKYINNKTPVVIICPNHPEPEVFAQQPCDHNRRKEPRGCPYCANTSRSLTQLKRQDIYIKQCEDVHGKGTYDYSKTVYMGARKKVIITCPKHGHGDFEQLAFSHLQGHGCPKCLQSKLEKTIHNELPHLIQQKTFEWLINKSTMRLDFYDEKTKTAIECQGIQHFKPVKSFGGIPDFKKTIERDKLKYELCEKHGVKVIYFFPSDFLQYDTMNFYGNKECYHDVEDIKKIFI